MELLIALIIILGRHEKANYFIENDHDFFNQMKRRTVDNSIEWSILIASILMSLMFLGALVYYLITDPSLSKTLGLVFIAHTFGGRAAGIGLCIMAELAPWVTVLYNFFLEILIVCWVYSLFVLSINNYLKFRGLRLFSLRLERKARKHKDKIANYGWIGIFLFVMAPFPATGPVIGSIVGYLLKFPVWRNFSAALFGTLTAIVVWFFFFDFLEQNLHVIRFVFGGIIGVAVLSYLFSMKNWFSKQE